MYLSLIDIASFFDAAVEVGVKLVKSNLYESHITTALHNGYLVGLVSGGIHMPDVRL